MIDPSKLFSLEGRTAVVTGGSRGIGEMIVEALLAAKARVLTTARSAEGCAALVERLSPHGAIEAASFDVANMAEVEAFGAWVAERAPEVDLLVNNAGATWGAPFGQYPEKGWDKVMDLNLKSVFFLSQRLAPQLKAAAKAHGRARIINIGSVDGILAPAMENYAYSASKAAVHHLTRTLARNLAAARITVNAIAPGPFRSKMTAFFLEDDAARASVEAAIPLGRIGAPEDMAGAILFLASAASDYITGAVLPLDGGFASLK